MPSRRPPRPEQRQVITDVRVLAALSHPVRIRLLNHLLEVGPSTATECAPFAGVSPSACSYHLRHLERFGLVERADREADGRDRPWRAVATGYSIGPTPSTHDVVTNTAMFAAVSANVAAAATSPRRSSTAHSRCRTTGKTQPSSPATGWPSTPPSCVASSPPVDAVLRPYLAVTRTDPPADARTGARDLSRLPPPGVMSRGPWRHRDFRLIWAGGLVNDTGDWLLMVALPAYVLVETGSGLTTALLILAQLVPTALLGSHLGNLVDRWDLRRTVVVTNVAQAATLLPLIAVTADRTWPAFIVAATQSVLTRFNNPANASLLVRVVDPTELTAANAARAASENVARLVGSPLGGIVVAFGGLPAVVLVDGISFLVVALATAAVRADASSRPRPAGSSTRPRSGRARRHGRAGRAVAQSTVPGAAGDDDDLAGGARNVRRAVPRLRRPAARWR